MEVHDRSDEYLLPSDGVEYTVGKPMDEVAPKPAPDATIQARAFANPLECRFDRIEEPMPQPLPGSLVEKNRLAQLGARLLLQDKVHPEISLRISLIARAAETVLVWPRFHRR